MHELRERGLDLVEDLRDLGRRHERLEVVQQHGVRRVVPLEALDVALLQLEVPLEDGEEGGEVVVRPRLDPDLVALRARAQHLGAELGRHLPVLLPVVTRDADQAGVVGVGIERLLERSELLEQRADLVVGELLVRDAAERRERLGARRVPAGRHRDPLVPAEHAHRPMEVGDLGEPLAERAEVRVPRR